MNWDVADDVALARLSGAFPEWECWYLPVFGGGTRWCARLRADHKVVVGDDSPAHLAETINDYIADSRDW